MAEQTQGPGIRPGAAIGWLGFGAVAFLGYKLLHGLGIIETPADRAAAADSAAAVARFDDYQKYTTKEGLASIFGLYQKETKKQLSTDPMTVVMGNGWATRDTAVAKKIYDSKGLFNDDEDALYSAFRNLDTIADLYAVNNFFYNLNKKQNVFDYVREFTNDDEREKITRILDTKPFYVGNKRKSS